MSLSSKVNVHHTINFMALYGANLVTRWLRCPPNRGERNPHTPPCGSGASCAIGAARRDKSRESLIKRKPPLIGVTVENDVVGARGRHTIGRDRRRCVRGNRWLMMTWGPLPLPGVARQSKLVIGSQHEHSAVEISIRQSRLASDDCVFRARLCPSRTAAPPGIAINVLRGL